MKKADNIPNANILYYIQQKCCYAARVATDTGDIHQRLVAQTVHWPNMVEKADLQGRGPAVFIVGGVYFESSASVLI